MIEEFDNVSRHPPGIAAEPKAIRPTNITEAWTCPIIGIEHRTPQEVFDIMANRFRFYTGNKGA